MLQGFHVRDNPIHPNLQYNSKQVQLIPQKSGMCRYELRTLVSVDHSIVIVESFKDFKQRFELRIENFTTLVKKIAWE